MSADEALRIAQNLARNNRWRVFPCGLETKAPTRPKAEGGNGFKDATTDPDEIEWLWRNWPGSLIGIATGAVSGVDVLDVDVQHDIALKWWDVAAKRIPPTRRYRTRSGGHHCYFQHALGICNTQSKLAYGIDSRGDLGYIAFWYGAGFECLDHAPLAPWPDWLRDCLLWQPPPKPAPRPYVTSAAYAGKAIDAIAHHVATAREGERNKVLFWAGRRMAERISAGQIGQGEATALLAAAAVSAGLMEIEASRTIASAMRAA